MSASNFLARRSAPLFYKWHCCRTRQKQGPEQCSELFQLLRRAYLSLHFSSRRSRLPYILRLRRFCTYIFGPSSSMRRNFRLRRFCTYIFGPSSSMRRNFRLRLFCTYIFCVVVVEKQVFYDGSSTNHPLLVALKPKNRLLKTPTIGKAHRQ